MTCTEIRELLLEADLDELRRERDGPLREHLDQCEQCRALADQIVRAEAALARDLAGAARTAPPDAAQRALDGAAHRARQRRWRVAVPALAAAAVAAVLLTRPPSQPLMLGSAASAAADAMPPLVEAPGSGTTAVFKTANPDIVVVWTF